MALTNAQHDQLMREYEARRLERQHLIDRRRAQLFAESPRFAQLEQSLAQKSLSKTRRYIDGDAEALFGLKEELAAISREKSALLRALQYPADFLEPPYTCPDCQDTGYVNNRRCHCLQQATIDLVYAQSHLSSLLKEETFDHFSLDYYSKELCAPGTDISSYAAAQNAFTKCLQFTQNFDDEYKNILLFGDTGLGKTFLSHCVARALLDTGHSVIYFSAHQLFSLLADAAFRKTPGTAAEYKNIFESDLLIIDDLGTEMTNAFTSSQFFVCLNERLLHRKSTLISSNLNLQDIAGLYSERVFSRITSDFLLLHLFGKDIRIQKNFLS